MRRPRSPATRTRTSLANQGRHESAAPTSCPRPPSARATGPQRSLPARSRADPGRTASPPGSCMPRTAATSTAVRSRYLPRTERPRELRHPEVHQIKEGIDARRTARVRRHDDGLRVGPLGDVHDLAAVIVVRRQQHLDVLIAHRGDDLLDVPWGRGNAGLGLDVIEASDLEFPREIIPLFVIARDQLPTIRQPLLEPSTEMTYQGRALIPLLVQEREELALTIQIRQRRTAKQLHEIVAEQGTVDPLFEILFAPCEVIGILRRDALQACQNIPRDDHDVERIGPDVRIAVHVDIALGS